MPPTPQGESDPHPLAEADALFDRSALADRLLQDEALIQLILETFAEELPGQVRALRAALAAADAAEARRLAHSIKGAAANVGALALSRLTLTLERLGAAGDLAAVTALLPQLEALQAATLAAMAAPPPPGGPSA